MSLSRIQFSDYALAADFPLSIAESDYANGVGEPAHLHDFYELVLVWGGSGVHRFLGEHFDIGAGNLFLVQPSQLHAYESTARLRLTSVLFFPQVLERLRDEYNQLAGYQLLFHIEPAMSPERRRTGNLRLPNQALAAAELLVVRIGNELRENQPGGRIAALIAFWELLLLISRECRVSEGRSYRQAGRIGQCVSYIARNYRQPLTLEQLARQARMPVSSFRRAFLEDMGVSPIRYLLRFRLDRAARMLADGSASVAEAAFAAGFTDSNYFSHQFTRKFGVSPSRYRYGKRAEPGGESPEKG